jgi:hypothetical protein
VHHRCIIMCIMHGTSLQTEATQTQHKTWMSRLFPLKTALQQQHLPTSLRKVPQPPFTLPVYSRLVNCRS